MSNPLKYSTSTPTGALRHDTLGAGVASIQYDENWNSGATPNSLTAYYLIYEPVNANTAVRIYAPSNAAELIKLQQSKGGSSTTEAGALLYLSNNGYYPANKILNNIVTDGLVVNLDSRTATSYPRSGTNWLDLSGEGNDSSLINSPTFNSNGFLEFDGVNDYVSLPSSIATALNGGTEASVCIWIKLNNQSNGVGDTGIIQLSGYTSGNGNLYFYSNGYTYLDIFRTSRVEQVFLNSSVKATYWHLLTVTTTSGTNGWKCYINNTLKKQATGDSTVSVNNSIHGGLSLGENSGGRYTYGDIASCYIYDKALTISEINQNYYQGPIVTNNLVFALDASNLVSFEQGTTAAFSLTGSSGAAAGDGVLTNGVGFSDVANGAWDFDGVDDTILSSYTLPSGDKTLEFWVNYNTLASSGGGGYSLMGVQQVNAYLYSGIQSNGSGYSYAGNTGGAYSYTFSASTWYHIATVMDNGTTRHYVNGIQVATKAYTVANASTIGVSIGAINSQHEMDALIPITRIYNRALTAAEVEQNYNANIKKFT